MQPKTQCLIKHIWRIRTILLSQHRFCFVLNHAVMTNISNKLSTHLNMPCITVTLFLSTVN